MYPNSIKFVDGPHKGLVFDRGTGPAQRVDIGGGVTFLANSTNFWYNGGNRSVSTEYLRQNKSQWNPAPWEKVSD